jgi:hypothetical protein
MISHRYLVKGNWPKNGPKFPIKNPRPLYAGLGGQVWPFGLGFDFDKATKIELQDLHTRMEQSRIFVDFGGSYQQAICADATIAAEYFAVAKKHCGGAWLLQVALPQAESSKMAGYDIGYVTGGFSVVETELITQGLPGPNLNELGLIQTLPDALAYFEKRKENEKLEQFETGELTTVSITVIQH